MNQGSEKPVDDLEYFTMTERQLAEQCVKFRRLQFQSAVFTSYETDLDWWRDWTLSNNDEEMSPVSYIIMQGEYCSDKVRRHIQGYVEFNKKMSGKQIMDLFGVNHLYCWKRRGTPEQARDYCTVKGEKGEKNGIWHPSEEYGELSFQGKRNDLIALRDEIKQGKRVNELMYDTVDEKQLHLLCHHNRTLKDLESFVANINDRKDLMETYVNVQWRPFQQQCLDIIDQTKPGRSVNWIRDSVGNKGKTFFANYLIAAKNAYLVEPAKISDIFYNYNKEPVVVFDVPRSCKFEDLYTVIEMFQNGRAFSSKYESKLKIFKVPHIFVFSNSLPNFDALSMDRWNVIDLDKPLSNFFQEVVVPRELLLPLGTSGNQPPEILSPEFMVDFLRDYQTTVIGNLGARKEQLAGGVHRGAYRRPNDDPCGRSPSDSTRLAEESSELDDYSADCYED